MYFLVKISALYGPRTFIKKHRKNMSWKLMPNLLWCSINTCWHSTLARLHKNFAMHEIMLHYELVLRTLLPAQTFNCRLMAKVTSLMNWRSSVIEVFWWVNIGWMNIQVQWKIMLRKIIHTFFLWNFVKNRDLISSWKF